MFNLTNPAQGPEKCVLALCSAGLLRSPTVAWVLSNAPYNYNTRAAGVDPEFALIGIDQYLLNWATEIVCVTRSVRRGMEEYCQREGIDISGKTIVTLEIPDIYRRRDPRLVAMIENQYLAWVMEKPA
jgi:predicted protein tyrosine phosphatase